ncbi:cation diffusion facilitator family transporter [Variovorax guangxiensis]|uniref:Cation transporter n=1 Tax=Variovorax guangxiensis TaxID=1775474 RepID=A0A502DID8_9BURK|nr:cation diffusion facilitator family transporter [Variovorax guangxiensis]RZI65753.1 MAG: cation transporter [Variovorax sp.]TPG21238.1 cation transporter [Variovorax ginsengisoli]TPG25287.1 cation transporter [Variovorax guangxiensis]
MPPDRPVRRTPWGPSALLRLSIAVALLTIVLKGAAGYITNSMGLISDAMESFVNLASAMFALAMVTIAARPADDDHPYGHHKAEYFSSGFEGILIVGAALAIGWVAVTRLLAPQPLEQLGWGLALSVVSSAFNAGLAFMLFRAAREHRSIALEADGRHLVTDVWTSAAVVVGIVAVHFTGWLWLDPLLAIGVALNIVREGAKLVWRSSQGLMDQALEPESLAALQATLTRFGAQPDGGRLRFDDIATRRAGQRRFADLHMHVPGDWSLQRAAGLRDAVEQALMDAVPGLRVTIQLLPLDMEARAVQMAEHE